MPAVWRETHGLPLRRGGVLWGQYLKTNGLGSWRGLREVRVRQHGQSKRQSNHDGPADRIDDVRRSVCIFRCKLEFLRVFKTLFDRDACLADVPQPPLGVAIETPPQQIANRCRRVAG